MKTYAMARIVIWSIVAVLCCGILFIGLSGRWNLFSFPEFTFNIGSWNGYSYINSEKYTAGGGSVAAADIQSVEINWTAGGVDAVPYDGDMIQFDETGYNGADENYAMRYLAENGKLTIQFCAPQSNWRFIRRLRKSLTVKLPRDLVLRDFALNAVSAGVRMEGIRADNLDVNSVSGGINLKDVNGDAMTLRSVSGDIDAENALASTLRADNVSGDINVAAILEKARLKTISGSVKLYAGEAAENIDVETVSGDIVLGLPENDGFSARYSSVSGGFYSEFPVEMSGKRGAYKNGRRDISFGTVSGDMRIIRAISD